MEDKNRKAGKNRILTLTIVMLCLLAIAIGLYQSIAAYITVSNMKAVASTNENEELFNSNYLYSYRTDSITYETRSLELNPSKGQEFVSFDLKIFNHNKEDVNIVNPYDVSYKLEIRITGANNNDFKNYGIKSAFSFTDASKANTEKVFESGTIKLMGRKPTVHSFKITMPTRDLGYAKFEVKATVVRSVGVHPGTNLSCLAAAIAPSMNSTVAAPSVDGKIVKSSDEIDKNTAFNYEVTVGGSESKVELTWDENIVEIDPFFAEEFKIRGNPGRATVVLPVGTRVIQFYRIKGLSEPSDWGDDDLGFSVKKASS